MKTLLIFLLCFSSTLLAATCNVTITATAPSTNAKGQLVIPWSISGADQANFYEAILVSKAQQQIAPAKNGTTTYTSIIVPKQSGTQSLNITPYCSNGIAGTPATVNYSYTPKAATISLNSVLYNSHGLQLNFTVNGATAATIGAITITGDLTQSLKGDGSHTSFTATFPTYPKQPQYNINITADNTAGQALTATTPFQLQNNVPAYTTTYSYQPNNKTIITDPDGNQTIEQFRAFSTPNNRQLMSITQANDVTTTITRTLLGQILSVKQGTLERDYHYNSNHFLTEVDNPETGKTLIGRNAIGQATSRQTGSSTADYTYNANGQLTSISYTSINNTTATISKTYNADSQLTSSSDSNGIWTYQYDANGNLISEQPAIHGKTYPAITYSYDNNDNLSSISYLGHETVNYAPNAFGQPTEVTPYVTQIHYYPNGHPQSYTDANGIITHYTENTRHMPNSITVSTSGGSPLIERNYQYDGDNNVTSIIDPLNSSNNQSFSYNSVNWLIAANGPWKNAIYTYDNNGNLTAKSVNNQQLTYTYSTTTDQLQAISGTTQANISHDSQGNINAIDKEVLTFNAANQLTQISGTNIQGKTLNTLYQYDANGNRLIVTNDGTTHYELYNKAGQLLYQGNLTGTGTDYIYLNGHQVAKNHYTPSTNTISYYHNNLLHSPVATSNQSGSLNWQQQYQPYGQTLNTNIANQPNTHLGFTGKPHDNNTNLSNYGARYYSPLLNRFTSIDPATVSPINPISFNRYAYAANNPYRYIDPTGMSFKSDVSSAASAVDGAAGGLGSGLAHGATLGSVSLAYNNKSKADNIAHDIGSVAGIGLALLGPAEADVAAKGVEGVADAVEAGAASLSTEARSATNGLKLQKALASNEQMGQTGKIIAGSTHSSPFRDASRVAKEYGGTPNDWVKKTSSEYLAKDKTSFQTHWVENTQTMQRHEFKTIINP